jgi:DNA-binding LacI/PurR family transcriptional regulator
MASLRDVAAEAGVSVATASRVASGAPGVRPATRARVERAMRELLYVRPGTPVASGTIAIVAPGLEDPSVGALVQALEAAATHAGLASLLGSVAAERQAESAHLLRERAVDGVVVVGEPGGAYRRLGERIPLVVVNGRTAGTGAPVVHVDERAGARLAAEHLLALGHAWLALVSPPAHERRAGFEAALLEAGLEPEDELVVHVQPTAEGGRAAARRLLARAEPPTGIVCGTDLVAMGILQEAAARGVRVPERLSVIGCGGPAAKWSQPLLTTLEQPLELLAATTVAALGTLLEQPDAELPDFVFRPRLREGGTTAPAVDG